MLSSSVGSGHPDRYSYEIPHEYLSGWGNLSGRIISIKRNHYSNLEAAALFDKLHFQKVFLFWSSYFYRIATFSEWNFYRAATFWE